MDSNNEKVRIIHPDGTTTEVEEEGRIRRSARAVGRFLKRPLVLTGMGILVVIGGVAWLASRGGAPEGAPDMGQSFGE